MDKENHGRSDDTEQELDNRQSRPTRRNTKKQYQGTRSSTSTKERRQTSMGTRQNHLHRREDIHSKQQKTQRKDFMGKP